MGMKTAACWFAPVWKVKSKALGEKEIKTIKFNIRDIVKDEIAQQNSLGLQAIYAYRTEFK